MYLLSRFIFFFFTFFFSIHSFHSTTRNLVFFLFHSVRRVPLSSIRHSVACAACAMNEKYKNRSHGSGSSSNNNCRNTQNTTIKSISPTKRNVIRFFFLVREMVFGRIVLVSCFVISICPLHFFMMFG